MELWHPLEKNQTRVNTAVPSVNVNDTIIKKTNSYWIESNQY